MTLPLPMLLTLTLTLTFNITGLIVNEEPNMLFTDALAMHLSDADRRTAVSSNWGMSFTVYLHGSWSVDTHIEKNRCNDVANEKRQEDWQQWAGQVGVWVLHRVSVERQVTHQQRNNTCKALNELVTEDMSFLFSTVRASVQLCMSMTMSC